jgi:GMP synthase (glutamine-hydrolysing)
MSTCQEKLSEREFVEPIKDIVGKCYVKHYSEVESVEEYDKVIICGTALKDNQYLNGDFSWLKETNKPVLGICSGMQIIALTFGGELINVNEVGMINVKVEKENNLVKDLNAYALHNKAVTDLDDFEILARSEQAPQIIKYKNIYGVLFHPEVRNKELIKRFLEI